VKRVSCCTKNCKNEKIHVLSMMCIYIVALKEQLPVWEINRYKLMVLQFLFKAPPQWVPGEQRNYVMPPVSLRCSL